MTGAQVSDPVRFHARLPAQMVVGDGTRLTAVATAASTAALALPTDAKLLIVRATGPIAYRFGASGVGAAAVDDNSVLFPPGEAAVAVPVLSGALATHVRVIRADAEADDYNVQFERVKTV